ncbi:hypothetical protein HMPREF9413_0656 [Paenibacillus sp. HGF7]|nr:hypothetical protein HMPREF9413_0656 [Paenibacillus sp. HGF7]
MESYVIYLKAIRSQILIGQAFGQHPNWNILVRTGLKIKQAPEAAGIFPPLPGLVYAGCARVYTLYLKNVSFS